MQRDYLGYAVPQRLLHLLADRLPWADWSLVEFGSVCNRFEGAAFKPSQSNEFFLLVEVNDRCRAYALPLALKISDFEGDQDLEAWADGTARNVEHCRNG